MWARSHAPLAFILFLSFLSFITAVEYSRGSSSELLPSFSSPLDDSCQSVDCGSGFSCCQGLCCSNSTESCCPDLKNGPVCCLEETTFCCPEEPDLKLPSRCCPRWNVCCARGRYGCCDPSTGLAVEESLAYTLFVAGEGKFDSETIAIPTGTRTSKTVSGYNDWDEVTRIFAYNPNQSLFHLPQANFLTSNDTRPLTLYTIDPVSAETTAIPIETSQQGQYDPPGFSYLLSTGELLMSTHFQTNTSVGYNFYRINITSGAANLVSTYENTTDAYVGWFTTATSDGNTVYRVGYYDVVQGTGPGISVTDISNTVATSQWYSNVPVPKDFGFYISLNIYGSGFLSLAPDPSGDLYIVQWSIGGNATVLSKLLDAHNTPIFGPIAEYINPTQTLYSALVVKDETVSDEDEWILVLYNLPNGPATEIPLDPKLYAKTTSASGLGIPTI